MPVNMESITLDVSKQPLITPTLYLGQYDANGTTLTAEIYDNGTPLNLDNYGVRFCMRLPNEISYYSVDGTASGNVATINIDETFAATVPGFTDIAYIEVFSGETVICSTNRINVIVLENAKEGADPSQSHSSAIDEAIEAANSAALAANNAAADASTAAGNASESAENASDAAQAASEAAENVTTAATNATTAADSANTATTNANNAAQSASASATAADTAAESANDASARAEAAIEAIGDISELAVPLMSESTRGGATLGQGLTVDGGALSIGDVVTDETNGPIYSVDAEGWAEQDGTPTPDNPKEVRVCRGRNLLDFDANTFDGYTSSNGQVFADSINKSVIVNVKPNTAYTFSGKHAVADDFAINEFSAYPATGDSGFRRTASITTLVACETFTTQPTTHFLMIKIANTRAVDFDATKATCQLELGTTPTPYVPYGHVGLEVQGRNLAKTYIFSGSDGDVSYAYDGKGCFVSGSGGQHSTWTKPYRSEVTSEMLFTLSPGTYSLSKNGSVSEYLHVQFVRKSDGTVFDGTFSLNEETEGFVRLAFVITTQAVQTINEYVTFQLEAGSTAHDYVPYAPLTTTPIPLPSKGWAGGLPDGTADVLNIDSAGGYEWDSIVERIASYNDESVGNVYLSTTGQLTTGAEVYYKSASTTESGYIDLPEVPENATITIPELREVGVRCFVHGVSGLVDHANNWGARCKQNESRIATLEAAIANLATS